MASLFFHEILRAGFSCGIRHRTGRARWNPRHGVFASPCLALCWRRRGLVDTADWSFVHFVRACLFVAELIVFLTMNAKALSEWVSELPLGDSAELLTELSVFVTTEVSSQTSFDWNLLYACILVCSVCSVSRKLQAYLAASHCEYARPVSRATIRTPPFPA